MLGANSKLQSITSMALIADPKAHNFGADKRALKVPVFQKDSPIAASVSEAILTLSENEKLKQLEAQWFTPSKECLASQTTITNDNLNWQSFWGLYAFSGITSTICCLLFFIHRFYQRRHQVKEGYSTTNHEDLSIELVKLVDDQLDGHSNMATNNQLLEPVVISDVSSYRNPHLS
ncbi:hypothetical protein TEA_013631 [Camellia sinensis var. sinensis]|uniref:Solute-binding protein family 3/N-terminal domain-containing protein n=1 Tax=Camellia sinensis var. sinensis TaxID=542762 RepID=A0A4S4DNX5_CAMSN|nr:hypothetical protein TEA_013631 [Camellia sinensis var. sinensis]